MGVSLNQLGRNGQSFARYKAVALAIVWPQSTDLRPVNFSAIGWRIGLE